MQLYCQQAGVSSNGHRLFHFYPQKGESMIRLECTTGGHNKFYEFHLTKFNGRVTVKGFYGAIGNAPQEALIYDGDSEDEARSEMAKKQNEKLRKGYVVVSSDGKPAPVPAQKKRLMCR